MRVPGHLPILAVSVAWLLFVASLSLPTIAIGGTDPLTGWELSTAWLEVFHEPLFLFAMVMKPGMLFLWLVPIITVAMLLAPLAVMIWDDAWVLSCACASFAGFLWWLKVVSDAHTFIGFHFCILSLLIMALAGVLKTVTTSHSVRSASSANQ